MNKNLPEITRLILESTNLKKQLIEKHSKSFNQVSRIMVAEARATIIQNQEDMMFFASLSERKNLD